MDNLNENINQSLDYAIRTVQDIVKPSQGPVTINRDTHGNIKISFRNIYYVKRSMSDSK